MRIKITVTGSGGEFRLGLVDDEDQIELIREKMESNELSLDTTSDDGEVSVEFFNFTDLVSAYGPNFDDSLSIKAEEVDEDDNVICELDEISGEDANAYIEIACPYIDQDNYTECNENSLIYGGYNLEKRMETYFYIDAEDFDISNVFFGIINLEDILNNETYIIDKCFYFSEDKLLELGKAYLNQEEPSKDDVISDLDSIYSSDDFRKYFDEAEATEKGDEPGVSYASSCLVYDLDGEQVYST